MAIIFFGRRRISGLLAHSAGFGIDNLLLEDNAHFLLESGTTDVMILE